MRRQAVQRTTNRQIVASNTKHYLGNLQKATGASQRLASAVFCAATRFTLPDGNRFRWCRETGVGAIGELQTSSEATARATAAARVEPTVTPADRLCPGLDALDAAGFGSLSFFTIGKPCKWESMRSISEHPVSSRHAC